MLKEVKLRGLVDRVLILAPKGVMLQWIAEMQGLFGERFDLVLPGERIGRARAHRLQCHHQAATKLPAFLAASPSGSTETTSVPDSHRSSTAKTVRNFWH